MPEHTAETCPQSPILSALNQAVALQGQAQGHILATLKRVESATERTTTLLEQMAANAATLESHTDKLKQHDKAFDSLFAWRNQFVEKQDSDFRTNLSRIGAIEKHLAIEEAVEGVVDGAVKTRSQFWADTRNKIEVLMPFVVAILFVFWILDRLNALVKAVELWKLFKG